jgi:hypothetical protein
VPGHHVEGREGLARLEHNAVQLMHDHILLARAVLKPGDRCLEVPRSCQPVGPCSSG